MFGSQNQQSVTIPTARVNNVDSPIHTMQEDLDMLAGKAPVGSPIMARAEMGASETPKTSPFSGDIEKIVSPVMPVEASLPQAPVQSVTPVAAPVNSVASPSPFAEDKTTVQAPIQAVNQAPQSAVNVRPNEPVVPVVRPQSVHKSTPNWTRVVTISVVVLLVIGLGSATYFFWMTRYSQPTEPVNPVVDTPAPVTPGPEPVTPVIEKKYSTDKPNYLTIPTKAEDVNGIKAALAGARAGVLADEATLPVEFIVTDENNNPVTFRNFTALMKMKFSSTLLNDFNDDFSLLLYIDEKAVGAKFGLMVKAKDEKKAANDVLREEKSLVDNLAPIFLDEPYVKNADPFKTSQYKSLPVRYKNVNDSGLSIDYAFMGKYWVVGTSKNTLRAILDKGPAESTVAVSDQKKKLADFKSTVTGLNVALVAECDKTTPNPGKVVWPASDDSGSITSAPVCAGGEISGGVATANVVRTGGECLASFDSTGVKFAGAGC
ncbi:hypothetical protein EPO05_01030 [Patescibacteria group bacterium]|nr:MAG: hypothetical protein EPO05_01030 [Patescibacteria group bacterium]